MNIYGYKEHKEVALSVEEHWNVASDCGASWFLSFHLQEESALYCSSGGKAPAGATDGLVLHWSHSTCKIRVELKAGPPSTKVHSLVHCSHCTHSP